jgi:AcrR family transcriptional regulator
MSEARPRGRPSAQASREVCQALLDAAEQRLQDKPFRDISVREIAALAGVNPAMINYYFNSKEGLFVALVEFLFTEWERRIDTIIRDIPGLSHSPTGALVELVDSVFFRHAPILMLLTRELAQERSGIQTAYREKLATRITASIRRFIEQAAEHGFYRRDMDLRHATLTLAALAIHPVSVEPDSLAGAYGIDTAELRSPQWLALLQENLDRVFTP